MDMCLGLEYTVCEFIVKTGRLLLREKNVTIKPQKVVYIFPDPMWENYLIYLCLTLRESHAKGTTKGLGMLESGN